MTAARRPFHNFSLQHAAALAVELARPLLVLEALRVGYPWASERLHRFVLEGMAANVFVVSARTSGKAGDKDGITLFLVPADAKGLSRSVRAYRGKLPASLGPEAQCDGSATAALLAGRRRLAFARCQRNRLDD